MSLAASLPQPRVSPPDLKNPSRYRYVPDVPIFASHKRCWPKQDAAGNPTGEHECEEVDDAQLHRIYENTIAPEECGEFAQIRLGHIDRNLPEHLQPVTVGYTKNYRLSEWNHQPVILADMYINQETEIPDGVGKKDAEWVLSQFGRRSAETFKKVLPAGYIDALALLKRAPEINLGLVTHAKQEDPSSKNFGYDYYSLQDESEFHHCFGDESSAPTDGPADLSPPTEIVTPSREHEMNESTINKIAERVMAMMDERVKKSTETHAAAGGAGFASGTNTFSPSPVILPKDKNMETHDDVTNSEEYKALKASHDNLQLQLGTYQSALEGMESKNTRLVERIDAIELHHKTEANRLRTENRRNRLNQLAGRGYDLDTDKYVDKFASRDDADFN